MSLPPDKVSTENKWVYKIKYKSNGTTKQYKAHLITKAYTQIKGIDYYQNICIG